MIERTIFYLLAFILFVITFIKLIRKNNTSYVYLLVLEFCGLFIDVIFLIMSKELSIGLKIVSYILSIIIPGILLGIEFIFKINFYDLKNLIMINSVSDDEKKIEILKKILDKNSNAIFAHKKLAEIYEKNEKYDLALDEYETILEKNEDDENAILKIGEMLSYLNRKEEAKEIFINILRRQPENYNATILLGEVLYDLKEFKEAAKLYNEALKFNKTDFTLYYNLGMVYTLLDDFESAEEAYKKAATINALDYNSKYALGQLEIIYGDFEEAEKYFNECLKDEEIEGVSYYYLARIAMIKGQVDKAKQYANLAIEVDRDMYHKICEDNIFMPIIEDLKKPDSIIEAPKKKKVRKAKNIEVELHLEKMCLLVGRLNNSDLMMIENLRKIKEEKKEFEQEKIKEELRKEVEEIDKEIENQNN